MTASAKMAMPPDQIPARGHRLVPRDKIYADCRARYDSDDVANYLLAVRDEVEGHPDIGAVGTWSKFGQLLKKAIKATSRDPKRRRKTLSRHFTLESKGPPWQTAMLVVNHVVPLDRQPEVQARFAELYEAARGEPPPTGRPTAAVEKTDDPAGQDTRKNTSEARTIRQLESLIAGTIRSSQQMVQSLTAAQQELTDAHELVIRLQAHLFEGELRSGPHPPGAPAQQQERPVMPPGESGSAQRLDWGVLNADKAPEVSPQLRHQSATPPAVALHDPDSEEGPLLENC